MNKPRLQVLLMLVTILAIAGFQLFWLRQTYMREKENLSIKTDLAFRDALQDLQADKFKFVSNSGDSLSLSKVKMIMGDSADNRMDIRLNKKKGIVSTINVIRKILPDSLLKDTQHKKRLIVTKEQTLIDRNIPGRLSDSGIKTNSSHLIQVLYGVDSFQDSLKITEIETAVGRIFKKESVLVPYAVSRLDSNYESKGSVLHEVSIGFAHPVTYKLVLGNTFPYLLKQISLPLLISLLLLGITILSFVLLYRNLLQQRRLTAIKNEFIGNITHELKTPIATVGVAIEAMKNFNALQNPARTEEYLGIAGQELNRLSMLVDKVLRLSMFENKQVELKCQPFNMAALLQEVIKSMQLQFEKSHATVSLEMKGIDFTIEADKLHLTSVLYNLLDNALKYSNADPVIRILLDTGSHEMVLQVADNGIGIHPAYAQKIFDKFFRVPHGDMHNVKGYGLGLSYAAHIIERHRGTIAVESDGTNGTTFTIKLPIKHAG